MAEIRQRLRRALPPPPPAPPGGQRGCGLCVIFWVWGCTVCVDFVVVAFDNGDDWNECATWVIPESCEEHFDCLFDLDEHGPFRWDRGAPQDDLFASARVCDCG